MSRFVNLEFDEGSDSRHQQHVVRDEAYYFTEATTAFEAGQFEQALRSYSKVLEFNPQNPVAWCGQVRALIELEEYREAKLWADKALERFPHDPDLLSAKAVALGRSGDLQGALAFSDAAIEEQGDTPYLWLARADVMLARAERRADYCFDKALALAPGDWFIAWLAARIRYFYDQFAQSLKLLKQTLEWNPGQSILWLMTGQCQRELGLAQAARTSLEQARQLNPQCHEAERELRALSSRGLGARLWDFGRRLFTP